MSSGAPLTLHRRRMVAADDRLALRQRINSQLIDWCTERHLHSKHQATRDRLAKLAGDAFDRAYVSEMGAGHQKAVADFTANQATARTVK